MLKAKLCATQLLSCNPSLWFSARSEKTSPWLLLCCHLVLSSPRRGQKPPSPHPHARPGAAHEQGELPLRQREEKEQHERVTACPGAPSALWPCFNLHFKVYLLFQRKQPVGSVSYDKGVNDGLSNSGQPEPPCITGSARRTPVAKGIIQYCCQKSVGINFSKAPIAPGGRLSRTQAKRPPETVGKLGNSRRTSCPPREVTNSLLPLCCARKQMEIAFIFSFKAKYVLKSTEALVAISITEGFGGVARSCLWPRSSWLPSRSSWLSAGCQEGAGNCRQLLSAHLIPNLHVQT